MLDLRIENGLIVDGTGAPRRPGTVGIRDGRIVAVGDVDERACATIDAKGRIVSPGFIDVHTHYDAQAFWDPMLSPSVYHGVTTVLAGNCGFTLAPLSGRSEDSDYLLRMLSRVEGMPLSALRQAIHPDWTSFGEYLDRLDGKLAINTIFLVGHSALRRTVMGERATTDVATDEDLSRMRDLLRRSIEQGGAGFSTTIAHTHSDFEGMPVPSRVASRDEIVALAAVAGEYPGTWLEMVLGVYLMDEDHYALVADMSAAAQRPLNWNAIQINTQSLEQVENKLYAGDYAKARGGKVYGLVPSMPMTTLLNFVNCFVIDTLPGWDWLVPMSLAERKENLADPTFRSALKAGAALASQDKAARITDWSPVILEGMARPENVQWNGHRLDACAKAKGKDLLDTLFDLAVDEDLGVSFARTSESTDDEAWEIRRRLWRDPRCLIGGSDAGAHLDMINTFAFSTQLLGEGVRRRQLVPLEEAVHRITGLPAEKFGLTGRGTIVRGAAADLVIFDPAVVDCGPITMRTDLPGDEKRLYADAVGIYEVIVNGIVVACDNRPTGKLGGRVLRSGMDTHTVSMA